MQIERTVTEKLKDSRGDLIQKDFVLVYREKSGHDNIGTFKGLKNGLLMMESLTDKQEYSIRPSSVTYCVIFGRSEKDGD